MVFAAGYGPNQDPPAVGLGMVMVGEVLTLLRSAGVISKSGAGDHSQDELRFWADRPFWRGLRDRIMDATRQRRVMSGLEECRNVGGGSKKDRIIPPSH